MVLLYQRLFALASPCLPHRLTKFIGSFIDHRQGSLSSDLCIPHKKDHSRHAYEHTFINTLSQIIKIQKIKVTNATPVIYGLFNCNRQEVKRGF